MATEDQQKDPIDKAYEERIVKLFEVLFIGYVDAQGDHAREREAEQSFQNATAIAKRARDRAKSLIAK
jgi:hypothetical protein